jgi:hypothetical protein
VLLTISNAAHLQLLPNRHVTRLQTQIKELGMCGRQRAHARITNVIVGVPDQMKTFQDGALENFGVGISMHVIGK